MAKTLTVTAKLNYKRESDTAYDVPGPGPFKITVANEPIAGNTLTVGVTEEAIPLGDLVAPLGWGWFWNQHATAIVHLRMATGGANDHIRIPAGAAVAIPFGDDVTAPYLISDTATTPVSFKIFSR